MARMVTSRMILPAEIPGKCLDTLTLSWWRCYHVRSGVSNPCWLLAVGCWLLAKNVRGRLQVSGLVAEVAGIVEADQAQPILTDLECW